MRSFPFEEMACCKSGKGVLCHSKKVYENLLF